MLIDYGFVRLPNIKERNGFVALLLSRGYKKARVQNGNFQRYVKLRYRDPADRNPENSDFAVWEEDKFSEDKLPFVVEILNHRKKMREILEFARSLYGNDCLEEGFNLSESAPPLEKVNFLTWIGERQKIHGYEDVVTSISSTPEGELRYGLAFKSLDDGGTNGNKEISVPANALRVRQKIRNFSIKMSRENFGKVESFCIA